MDEKHKDKSSKKIKAIELNEKRFFAIAESSADAIIGCSHAGTTVSYWNKAAENIFGYPSKEIIGKPLEKIIPEKLRQAHKKGVKKFISKKQGKNLGKIVELKGLKKNGEEFPIEFSYGHWETDGQLYFMAIVRDITVRKRLEKTIEYQAHHDLLTNLPNRTLFNERLTAQIAEAKRYNEQIAVFFLDLDYFKEVNDKLGHMVGDELLAKVGERLRDVLRAGEIVSRVGGDEFLISSTRIRSSKQTAKIAERLVDTLHKPFIVDKHKIHIAVSIGISIYPQDGQSLTVLIRNADIAMYFAKNKGRDRFVFFDEIKETLGKRKDKKYRIA